VGPAIVGAAADSARGVAERAGARPIDPAGLEALLANQDRTVYRFDVRDPDEYVRGHLCGFRSAPGGQLVQETDVFAPVRGAVIVVGDDDGVRANMTASWLAQMNWDVRVVDQRHFDTPRDTGSWNPTLPSLPDITTISVEDLAERYPGDSCVVVDVATSSDFLAGHLPGARFALRVELPSVLTQLRPAAPVVVTSGDGTLAAFAAAEVEALVDVEVLALAGGTAAWQRSGRPLESGEGLTLSPFVDVYRRPYEGTNVDLAAMEAYLQWEYGLVGQLARDGTHGFRVI
jgi:rhodanese-related sulfurtransferase